MDSEDKFKNFNHDAKLIDRFSKRFTRCSRIRKLELIMRQGGARHSDDILQQIMSGIKINNLEIKVNESYNMKK